MNRICYRLSRVLCALAQISCFNPIIPGLGRRQSRNSGLAKTAGIPGFGILGLQSLVVTVPSRHACRKG